MIYVDRTKAIAQLDAETVHSCLWSPRRTGKTLLVNQLALWHDKAIAENEVFIDFNRAFCSTAYFLFIFQRAELFSGTYIGQNPSFEAGKYLVLAMDFSGVNEKDVAGSFTKVLKCVGLQIL